MANDESPNSDLRSPILTRVFRFLRRMDVAAVLIFATLSVAALGSCFPQLTPPVSADLGRMNQWEAEVRARYGGLTDLLAAGGAFRCFRSPLFLVPLAMLALATLVCTLDRWRGVWRRAFYRPVRGSDDAFQNAPHAATMTAPLEIDAPRLIRECLEQRGFRVSVDETADSPIHMRGDRNWLARLATLVTHLAVILLLLGGALSAGYGWREELSIGPEETVDVGHGSGLALRNDGFSIARHPDGSVAGYEAVVMVVEGGQETTRGRIRVNEPLAHGPVALFLRGYGGAEGQQSITLLVARDPGYGWVIVAGFLLLLGLTVSFNFPHCWVYARIESGGTLRLAGRADRRACDFGREFAGLVGELERAGMGCQR
jgi:cytochrome c biogenesis protein